MAAASPTAPWPLLSLGSADRSARPGSGDQATLPLCALACNVDVSCEAHRRSLWTSHPAAANHSPTKRSGFKPPPCSFSPCPQWVGSLELPGLRALVCGHQMLARVPSAKDHPRSRGSHPRQALREPVNPPTGAPHDCRSVLVLCNTQARRPRLRPSCPSLRRDTSPPAGFHRPCASAQFRLGGDKDHWDMSEAGCFTLF